MTMLKLGLTGGIASGKSAVAAMLREMGFPVLDADSASHRLMEPGQQAHEEILKTFDTRHRKDYLLGNAGGDKDAGAGSGGETSKTRGAVMPRRRDSRSIQREPPVGRIARARRPFGRA